VTVRRSAETDPAPSGRKPAHLAGAAVHDREIALPGIAARGASGSPVPLGGSGGIERKHPDGRRLPRRAGALHSHQCGWPHWTQFDGNSHAIRQPLRRLEPILGLDRRLWKKPDFSASQLPDRHTGVTLVTDVGRQMPAVRRPLRRPTGACQRKWLARVAGGSVYQHHPTAYQIRRHPVRAAKLFAGWAIGTVLLDSEREPAAVRRKMKRHPVRQPLRRPGEFKTDRLFHSQSHGASGVHSMSCPHPKCSARCRSNRRMSIEPARGDAERSAGMAFGGMGQGRLAGGQTGRPGGGVQVTRQRDAELQCGTGLCPQPRSPSIADLLTRSDGECSLVFRHQRRRRLHCRVVFRVSRT
jgi:hypothetical protein